MSMAPRVRAGVVLGLAAAGLSAVAVLRPPALAQRRPSPALLQDAFSRIAAERATSVVFLHTTTASPADTGNPAPLLPQPPQGIEGLGSGVLIDRDGMLVTNAHVVADAQAIHVRTPEGDDIPARVVGADPDTDLALVKMADPAGLTPAPLGDSDAVRVGDWVLAIGNPLGLHHTATAGIISAKARGDGSGLEFLQTDAAINPGNSGGPLFDLRGRVIGINTAILTESRGNVGLNFAIPANTLKDMLPQLRSGRVRHGWFGVVTRRLSRRGAAGLDARLAGGLLISAVVSDSPAARAGLKMGDVILSARLPQFVEARQLHTFVLRSLPGTRLQLEVWRDGATRAVDVELAEKPR